MKTLPPYRFLQCRFYTPIGATNVGLHDGSIIGDWKHKASNHYGDKGRTLAEQFANSDGEVESILQFTRRWGPLSGNPHDGNDGFRFTIASWIGTQMSFPSFWRLVQKHGAGPFDPERPVLVEFEAKAVTLQCPDLYTFMCLEVLSNAKSLRVCKRDGCKKPHFLAQHGKEQYCSTECANWAQSVWKRRWHEERRNKRIKLEEGNGTQETR